MIGKAETILKGKMKKPKADYVLNSTKKARTAGPL
jgi:hypothetical protein